MSEAAHSKSIFICEKFLTVIHQLCSEGKEEGGR